MPTQSKRSSQGGFTMLEMAAVLAIITVLLSVLYFNFRQFNSNTLVTNLAYEIALSIREAQTYGLSVKEATPGSGIFNYGYGVYFSPSKTSYVFFEDKPDDGGAYDHQYKESDGEKIKEISITGGNKIVKICLTKGPGSEKCSTSGDIRSLAISFLRPNPEAIIGHNDGKAPQFPDYRDARIVISSSDGSRLKVIFVASTGQISIQEPYPQDLDDKKNK